MPASPHDAPTDSLRRRYLYKLAANVAGLSFHAVTQSLIPRGLGPRAYGDFAFLTDFFTQLTGFLDMGSSTGFYTKLSRRPGEAGLVSFYACVSVAVFLGILALVGTGYWTGAHAWIWPSQAAPWVCAAAVWGLLFWSVQILTQMADAWGLTVSTERARMLQRLLGMLLIILLFASRRISLASIFGFHYLSLLALGAAVIWIMRRAGHPLRIGLLSEPHLKGYLREFIDYSHPLFLYSLVGLTAGLADRWLLQHFGGSVQQGLFGLSYQIGALCFLFTGALTPLLTREFSIAHGRGDLARMASLFRRTIPPMYSIAAFFSCFVAMQADTVIRILGGVEYHEASLAVMVMAFFPLHQTYGQLSGSVFLATGRTAAYRNIGTLTMLAGLPATYFLIAPASHGGLGTGATGLAAKMLFLQAITVNIQLYFNTRMLGLSLRRHLVHQLASPVILLALAWTATAVAGLLLGHDGRWAPLLTAGVLYTSSAAALTALAPAAFGIDRQDLVSAIQALGRRLPAADQA